MLSPWQNELRTVYPPFPLLNVFKQELMRKYGDEDKTREAYNELLKENKSRDIHFTDIGSLDFIKGVRSESKTINDNPLKSNKSRRNQIRSQHGLAVRFTSK